MYFYKSLKNTADAEIANCLNLAFSDYAVPIQLTESQLRAVFVANGVDKALSYGAFLDGELIGFILNSCSIYQGQKAVFDVGTGVVPAHRGKKVFTNLFAFAEQDLRMHGVEKYYLETLQDNGKAISAYTKQGFSIQRTFSVLRALSASEQTPGFDIDVVDMPAFEFCTADCRNCIQPSFENSTGILNQNPALYAVAYKKRHKVTAYCVFAKDDGHLAQLGYDDIADLKGIVEQLLTRFGSITAKNISREYPAVLEMLFSAGFVEVAGQFEMVKDLKIAVDEKR